MNNREFIYLSQKDVIEAGLTMCDVMSVVEDVFREHACHRVENPPKIGVHPRADSFIHAMPGYFSELKVAGLKWVSGFPSNYIHYPDLPTISGLIILNDVDSGRPLAVMDCGWITAARTGAVSGVAAKYLAKNSSEVVGIVGAGIQGRASLLALREAMPSLQLVRAYDINLKALDTFKDQAGQLTGLRIEAAASAEEALREADIIVTATGRLDQPYFRETWAKPGALILPIHHRGWENETLHRVDKLVCDDWPQLQTAHREWGGFYGPLPALAAELGEVVVGRKPGRETDTERIIDFNLGLAIEDVAVAAKIYSRAVENGLGKVLPLFEGESCFQIGTSR